MALALLAAAPSAAAAPTDAPSAAVLHGPYLQQVGDDAVEVRATEEGLAAVNTLLTARTKLLWNAALSYYARWLGASLGYTELFLALRVHVPDPSRRWAQCVRTKRGLEDCSKKGALAKDQCYLEGAWRILERQHDLHFDLLHSGLVAVEEHEDALKGWMKYQATVRTAPLVVPRFLRDMEAYIQQLDEMAETNGVQHRARTSVGQRPRGLSSGSQLALLSRNSARLRPVTPSSASPSTPAAATAEG